MIFAFELQSAMRRGKLLILILAAAFLFSACGKKLVATAASEFEANLMFDILHSNGFRVDRSALQQESGGGGGEKTWEITVDEGWFGDGDAATAIQVLRDYGLPRPPEPEIKSGDSFGIVSDREEKERQRRDLQQQVERQLYTLPDVIRVSVIIAQPTDDVLSLEKTPPSASVSLVLKETQPKFTVEAVQTLVSGDVPKLKPENVKVLVSQQSLREIPLEKLAAQRRSNQVFAVGGGVVILLTLALGAVLYMSKRRKQTDDERLTESEMEETAAEFDKYKPAALLDGEDNEDEEG